MKRFGLTIGFLVLAPVILIQGAMAAGIVNSHDTDKPVTITADAQDFDLKAKTVSYKGNGGHEIKQSATIYIVDYTKDIPMPAGMPGGGAGGLSGGASPGGGAAGGHSP